MINFLENIYFALWGPFTIIFIFCTGIFLTLKLKFIQIRKFYPAVFGTIGKMFRRKTPDVNKATISPFQAVSTALAGTVGVGSLAGVSTAISIGGPGAVFWMWVAGFFGMATKFFEIVLSVQFREKNSVGKFLGGPMFYMKNGLKSPFLGFVFSLACFISTFGMGNAVQSNTVSIALQETINLKPQITGIILSVLVGSVIFGGIKKIASINEKLVPFMAIFYFVCCTASLVILRENLASSFFSIFKSAFGFSQSVGGFVGFSVYKMISTGISKGIFISEVGLGSAAIAHGATEEICPNNEGLLGIFETFITTFLISTITALVILSAGVWKNENLFGIELTLKSFNAAIPHLGSFCITITTIFFSLSTILGWAYYGEISLHFLFKKININLFRICFVFTVFISSFIKVESIWLFSEIANALMLFPNLISLILLSKNISKELINKKIGVY